MNNLDAWLNRTLDSDSSKGSTQKPTPDSAQVVKKSSTDGDKKASSNKKKSKPVKNTKNQRTKSGTKRSSSGRGRSHDSSRTNDHLKPAAVKRSNKPAPIHKGKLRVIPIGGLNEVGKNMTVLEYEDDIIIIDIGFEFPSEDMLGIDYVVPDVSYLEDKLDRIRGVVLTHGHLDHIGGLPYILPKLNYPPVYGTKLTMGLVENRNDEFKINKYCKLYSIDSDDVLKLGKFTCKFIRVMHSIPDCVAVHVECPAGKVFHTGDFKFDDTPARNIAPAEIGKMEQLHKDNIDLMLCESTNALKPGHSMSEQEVGNALMEIVRDTPGRIIVASFSSQMGRLQQIIDAGAKHGRKVFVSGRSMQNNIEIAYKLGYLSVPKGFVQDIKKYKNVPDHEALILTTGSQGEPVSALTRMANNEHPHLKIRKGDTIVLSSNPIVGNEKAVYGLINQLTILGAEVIHNQIKEVHTSGHGRQEELVRMMNYVRPKYLAPIHGEYYMRFGLSKLAAERCGIPEEKSLMMVNGSVIEIENGKAKISKEQIDAKYILIDGRGEGRMDSAVQSDREILSQNGALVVMVYINRKTRKPTRSPEVVSRGFMYMHESKEIIHDIIDVAAKAYKRIQEKNPGAHRGDIKRYIRQSIDDYTHRQLARRPLIIPLIIED